MSLMKNAKEFFGLAPTGLDAHDAYYDDDYRHDDAYAPAGHAHGYAHDGYAERDAAPVASRPASARGYAHGYEDDRRDGYGAPAYRASVVTVDVATFNDAIHIGEPYREGDAVVFDLTALDRAEAKRIIDFTAGLTVALEGKLEKISKGLDTDRLVFALQPAGAGFSVNELRRAAHLI